MTRAPEKPENIPQLRKQLLNDLPRDLEVLTKWYSSKESWLSSPWSGTGPQATGKNKRAHDDKSTRLFLLILILIGYPDWQEFDDEHNHSLEACSFYVSANRHWGNLVQNCLRNMRIVSNTKLVWRSVIECPSGRLPHVPKLFDKHIRLGSIATAKDHSRVLVQIRKSHREGHGHANSINWNRFWG